MITTEKNDGLCMGVGIKFFEEKFEMLKDKIKGRLLNEEERANSENYTQQKNN